jgi:S-adenosylmethionine decarboxylase proenzyme
LHISCSLSLVFRNDVKCEEFGKIKDMVGKHLFLTAHGVRDKAVLETLETGLPLFKEIVAACDLHVVNECGHQFEPHGYTYVFLLSESHMSVHTYPEYGSFYLDIFCCNKEFNPRKALETVKKLFGTEIVDWNIVDR